MKISIGADHRGFAIKQALIAALSDVDWLDVGAESNDRSDYPIFAQHVVEAMRAGKAEQGVLICGSGIGMAIAANRHPGIYAGLCWNSAVATVAKEHDDINVLVLPADFVSVDEACAIVRAWLSAQCKEGRYRERLLTLDKR